MDRRCSAHEMNAVLRSGYNSPEGPGRTEQSVQASRRYRIGNAGGEHIINCCA